MAVAIRNITFDCAEPFALAEFWARATGYGEDPRYPHRPGDTEVLIVGPDGGPGLLFIAVPEGKAVKNRVHLDTTPREGTRDAEVERLCAIGATVVDDRRTPDGKGWVVLADPEGNEFCVERGAAERAGTP